METVLVDEPKALRHFVGGKAYLQRIELLLNVVYCLGVLDAFKDYLRNRNHACDRPNRIDHRSEPWNR